LNGLNYKDKQNCFIQTYNFDYIHITLIKFSFRFQCSVTNACRYAVRQLNSDGTIHSIVSNIVILKAYRIVSNIAIIPSQTIRYFALLY